MRCHAKATSAIAVICGIVVCLGASPAAAFDGLPDRRAYEQASPLDKNGASVQGETDRVQAASDGSGVVFYSTSGIPGGEGAQDFPIFLASRTAAGWSTQGLMPPASAGAFGTVLGWSEDLKQAYLRAVVPGASQSIYQRDNAARSLRLMAGDEKLAGLAFAGASSGGAEAVFESSSKVLPNALEGKSNVYVWDRTSGELSLVSVLNSGKALSEGAFAGPYNWFYGQNPSQGGAVSSYYTKAQHVISVDGSRVFFTAAGTGQLYMRQNPTEDQSPLDGEGNCSDPSLACTIRLSASRKTNGAGLGGTDPNGPMPAAFMAATPDGAKAFFTSSEELTNDSNTGPEPGAPPIFAIGRAKLDGSEADPTFIPTLAKGITVDGAYVYWADPDADTIGRAKLDGSEADQEFITGASNPQGVAVDATHIFWANAGTLVTTRRIGRAKLDGEEVTQEFVKNNVGAGNPGDVVVSGAHIYFSRPSNGTIGRVSLNGTTDSNLSFITGLGRPQGLFLDGTYLYWADDANDAIGRAKLDGSELNPAFIPGLVDLEDGAVDDAHVYWSSKYEKTSNPGNDLYRYDADTGGLIDLTPNETEVPGADVRGVLGVSDDGSHAYFAANGVLAGGASTGNCSGAGNAGGTFDTSGICNLYLWHEGAVTFIAQLDISEGAATSDALNWLPSSASQPVQPGKTANVTPDGSTLLFRSKRQLTAYDNEGHHQLYRYSADDDQLICVSCIPTGAPPTGSATLRSIESFAEPQGTGAVTLRNLSASGDRVFFESPDELVSGDVNGVTDVYEWEAKGSGSCDSEAQNGGCLYLLSTGTSPRPSYFADASVSGDDAFIFTAQQLVAQDKDELVDVYDARVDGGIASQNVVPPVPCEGEACRSQVATSPAVTFPGSATLAGPSNQRIDRKKKKRRKQAHEQRKRKRHGKSRKGKAKQKQRHQAGKRR